MADTSWFGFGGGILSTLYAVADPNSLVVPIICALIAASVPLTGNAIVFWRDRRAHDDRVGQLIAENERLRKQLAEREVKPDA